MRRNDRPIDLIIPRLYVGNVDAARNRALLKHYHITHIVDAAAELPCYFPRDFHYLELKLMDQPVGESLKNAVLKAYNFISHALANGGVVLVHCAAGISRSTSTVIFYLMNKFMIPYEQALRICRKGRPITNPNMGYEAQLETFSRNLFSQTKPTHRQVR